MKSYLYANSGYRGWAVITTVCVLLLTGSYAWAEALPATAVLVRVDAAYGTDTGSVEYYFPVGTVIEGSYSWDLEEPVTIWNATNTLELTTVETLNLVFNADPAVTLNFSVVAGNYGSNITVTSAVITFDPIVKPYAYATAAVTVTDNNFNGATLTGLLTNGAAYEARYNNPAITWASLLTSPVSAAVGSTGNDDDRRPALPTIWETIPATVGRISSQFKFHLTAADSASGTSRFEVIVPEPTSLGLLLVAGLAVLRRWR